MANTIISSVVQDVHNLSPSSDAVFKALQDKATLNSANIFKSSNYFPSVDIFTAPDSQATLAVNVFSVKKYVSIIVVNTLKTLEQTKFERFNFTVPRDVWTINHMYNASNVNLKIYDSDNRQQQAPFTIVDNNKIEIYFSTRITGYVLVEFVKNVL